MPTSSQRGGATEGATGARDSGVAISIRDIVKEFDARAALRGVSLEVEPGELLALLGPSGSGKTTLLRIIAGLDTHESGSIWIDGRETSTLSVQERRVGFVFQHYALFRHMTVFDNIAYGLTVRSRRTRPPAAEIRKRVMALLDLVQLQELEKRYPAQLSGGQRQRVALARALAIEPRVLLLDEPFGALDARVRKELRRWLRDIHSKTGQTTIFVTHDQDEAMEVADRVAILNAGLIEQLGRPATIYAEPGSAFIASFVGDPTMLAVDVADGQVLLGPYKIGPVPRPIADGPAKLFVRASEIALVPDAAGIPARVGTLFWTSHGRRAEVTVEGVAGRFEVDLPNGIDVDQGSLVALSFLQLNVFR